jgi:hypothetical protein
MVLIENKKFVNNNRNNFVTNKKKLYIIMSENSKN